MMGFHGLSLGRGLALRFVEDRDLYITSEKFRQVEALVFPGKCACSGRTFICSLDNAILRAVTHELI